MKCNVMQSNVYGRDPYRIVPKQGCNVMYVCGCTYCNVEKTGQLQVLLPFNMTSVGPQARQYEFKDVH